MGRREPLAPLALLECLAVWAKMVDLEREESVVTKGPKDNREHLVHKDLQDWLEVLENWVKVVKEAVMAYLVLGVSVDHKETVALLVLWVKLAVQEPMVQMVMTANLVRKVLQDPKAHLDKMGQWDYQDNLEPKDHQALKETWVNEE